MPSGNTKTPRAIWWGAVLFACITFLISWWHWWTFQYGTFDLAFYVQSLWLALRGQWNVSLLGVSLMGNHAEPIVFLFTPFFAVWSHPMLFVIVQTIALATMPFTAWRISRRLGIERVPAILLSLATVLTPATITAGIYEFHPEALSAPLILLLIEAKLAERRGAFWLWFVAVLSVKENMSLLLVAWCVVFAVIEWKRGRQWVVRWSVVPGIVAMAWFLVCAKVISPALNAGNVDYAQLYSHLGTSGGDIIKNFFVAPQKAGKALWNSLTDGNMVWALSFSMLALPFFRLRWWFIAAPLLGQHLLSLRFSEWSLGAHYPAPLIPLFWIAAAETFTHLRAPRFVAIGIVVACVIGQVWVGPVRSVGHDVSRIAEMIQERDWKAQMMAAIPADASVMASQPYLSHLAKRERALSLHHVLKGLKTLSKEAYVPPAPTDVVLIDYGDTTTFSTAAGFYHPRMKVDGEREVPSSDRLLHEYLAQAKWRVLWQNDVALLVRGEPTPPIAGERVPTKVAEGTTLTGMQLAMDGPRAVKFRISWEFEGERQVFPWMLLVLSDGKKLYPFLKGACAPEAGAGNAFETWTMVFPDSVPAGTYSFYAHFYNANEAAWNKKTPPSNDAFTLRAIDIGQHEIGAVAQ